jgi:hypothetical protein
VDVNPDLLPQSVRERAEVIGLDGVLLMIDKLKGRQLKVPKRFNLDHPLAVCLGRRSSKPSW